MEIKLILVSFLAVSLIPDLSIAKGNTGKSGNSGNSGNSGKSGNSGNSVNQCSDQPCGDHGTCHLKTGEDNGHCFCPGNNPACSGDCNTEDTCTFPSGKGGNQCKLTGSQTPGGCVCRRDYVCTCETGWTGQHCDQPATPPECTDYKTLTEKDRSVQYDKGGVKTKDGYGYQDTTEGSPKILTSPSWSGEGWYRVEGEAGTRLAEEDEYPGENHCGIFTPGYMNAKHNDVARYETKKVEFCFGSRCDHPTTRREGKITNCNRYFVYYLPATAFQRRYCSVP